MVKLTDNRDTVFAYKDTLVDTQILLIEKNTSGDREVSQ